MTPPAAHGDAVVAAPAPELPFPATPRVASLRTPIFTLRVLALLCIVLPLIAYAAVGAWRYQQIRAEAELRLDRAMRIAQEHALKILDTNETVLAWVLDAVSGTDDANLRLRERQLHEQLNAMARNKPQIQSIWVHDADGRPIATDRVFPVPADGKALIADREYFRWHRSRPGSALSVSAPLTGKVSGASVFVMSRARHTPDGQFSGLVSSSLLPSYFANFHKEMSADEPGLAITMLREDGVILSRWPPLPGAPPALAANSPVMTSIRAGITSGAVGGVSSVDGRDRLLNFGKVGPYPIYLGTGLTTEQIMRRWSAEMAWLAAFGLPPLLGLFLAGRVALRRTREALESAERLSEEMVARRRVEEALLQAQKLEALGRLTGGVAHDFNNALMVISNNLFLHQRKHPEADGPHLASIGRAVGSATKLTRQLLAFSRRQALVPEHMQLQERLPTLRDLLGPVLGKDIDLQVVAADDTRAIRVDPAEFELALINLAINARDAMPSGGRLRIAARNATGPLPPTLHGDMVVVEAIDSGSGIDPEIIDKVFEPFFTTKPVGEGTGLGLSQIYGLCQRAGGLATIDSTPGQGTTVRLWFPAMAERPAAASPETLPPQRSLERSVLLVEDNDEVAAALKPVLESLGCSVTRLDRGEAAKRWLAAQASLPDLLLSDVVMPGDTDGLALAQHVRAVHPSIKIILMTGYARQLDTIAEQGFEVLPKPCSAAMLATLISRVSTQSASVER